MGTWDLPIWIGLPLFVVLFVAASWAILLALRPWVKRASKDTVDWDRTLGYAMAAEYLKRGWRVVGTVRGGATRTKLHDLADASDGRLEIETVDICEPAEIAALQDREHIPKLVASAKGLDAEFLQVVESQVHEYLAGNVVSLEAFDDGGIDLRVNHPVDDLSRVPASHVTFRSLKGGWRLVHQVGDGEVDLRSVVCGRGHGTSWPSAA